MKTLNEELKKQQNTSDAYLSNKQNVQNVMDYLLQSIPIENYKNDDLINGTVLGKGRVSLYVDLGFGTGVVFGRDYIEARDIIKSLMPGDNITAKILDFNDINGYIGLSLKEASRDAVWREIEDLRKNATPVNAVVFEANKGGLMLSWNSISGFLPTSNLKVNHYPRVEGGDKGKIVEELKKIIGQTFQVIITDINQKENSLIFSEKAVKDENTEKIISKYNVGDIIESEVSGIVDFGIFVKIDEKLEGLVHISELDWSLVESPAELFKIGDKIKAKVIEVENNKISLSIKALKPDPWQEVKAEYHKGDIMLGVVIRFNKHGALVSVREGVAGLAHISQFGNEKQMKIKLELGKSYHFQISFFSPEEHRLTFNFVEETK